LDVFLSVDLEDGYSDSPSAVAAFVASLPVAGLNIEDSSQDRLLAPGVLAGQVAAVKERCPDVFVNARVDTYWLGPDATVEATLVRVREYVAAGADGIFVPGASGAEVVPYRAALYAALEAVEQVRATLPPVDSVAYAALQDNLLRFVGAHRRRCAGSP
jgi:2-methylisocitrate lyase-like PEP mutase family enzyme